MAAAAWWCREYVRNASDDVTVLDPAKAVWTSGESLYSEQGETRRSRADASMFLYYGNARRGLRGSRFVGSELWFGEDPPFRNIVQSCVDTKTAHVFRNKVRCYFLTSKGDSELKEKAQGMTRAVEAAFTDAGIYGMLGFLVCQDGHLFEAGGVKITPDFANNRVLCDRVFPWECFVPEEEARSGNPRQMFHRQPVDRQSLIAMFPDHEELIKAAPSVPDDWKFSDVSMSGQTSDLVAVWEAWHLPSCTVDLEERKSFGVNEEGKLDSKIDPEHDGRHIIAIANGTLLDRPWPFDYFPFAWYRPNPDPVGYWSRSIPESLAGVQLELIKLGRRIQALIHLHAVPRLVAWRGAKINKNVITNDYASIIETSSPPGNSLMYLTPQAVPAELFRREGELTEWAAQQVGLSDLSLFAQKPAGVDHAPGMQHLADTESIRHTPAYRSWEDFHLQCGRAHVDAFRQLAEVNKDFSMIWGDSKDLKRIKWTEVDIERSKYHLRVWPTNLLPSTPAAKASRVLDFVNAGVFTPTMALGAMEYPDIEDLTGDTVALEENIERKLESVVKDGFNENNAPHPYMDLALAKALARERINRLEADGEEPAKVDDVRKFWNFADDLEIKQMAKKKAAEQGLPPPPEAPPPSGGGEPMPEPVPAAAA
jgi:hypothetical protein